jgi:hypothetical protein
LNLIFPRDIGANGHRFGSDLLNCRDDFVRRFRQVEKVNDDIRTSLRQGNRYGSAYPGIRTCH